MNGTIVRKATINDVSDICDFVRQLADYERLLHEVVFREEQYSHYLFLDSPNPKPEVLIAETNASPIGIALFIQLTNSIIHLEDLFVSPASRGKGAGIMLLKSLAREAVARGVTDLRWNCLDWNKTSIAFYESLGAHAIEGQILYRLHGKALSNNPKISMMFTANGVVERTPSRCCYRLLHESVPLVSVATSLSFTTFVATPVLVIISIDVARPGHEALVILVVDHLRREAVKKGYARLDILLNTKHFPTVSKLLLDEFDFYVMSEWVPFQLDNAHIHALAHRDD